MEGNKGTCPGFIRLFLLFFFFTRLSPMSSRNLHYRILILSFVPLCTPYYSVAMIYVSCIYSNSALSSQPNLIQLCSVVPPGSTPAHDQSKTQKKFSQVCSHPDRIIHERMRGDTCFCVVSWTFLDWCSSTGGPMVRPR